MLPPQLIRKFTVAAPVCLLVACLSLFVPLTKALAETPEPAKDAPVEAAKPESKEPLAYDFEHEDTFMDVPDALRSRQFVHRAILSTIIRDSAKVTLGSFYFDQMLGFNATYQPSKKGASFAKYASGVLGFGLGYALKSGHALEFGLDISGVSNMIIGYRYFFQSENYTFWPFLGAGLAMEMASLKLSDLPVEAKAYRGPTSGEFITIGAIIPLVDVAFRAEAKFIFYGFDRLMLTTNVGVVFFL